MIGKCCATQFFAVAVRGLIDQYLNNTCAEQSGSENYYHSVTADDVKMGEQHLRDFQDNEKDFPTILTTSQKLGTGVDAP